MSICPVGLYMIIIYVFLMDIEELMNDKSYSSIEEAKEWTKKKIKSLKSS